MTRSARILLASLFVGLLAVVIAAAFEIRGGLRSLDEPLRVGAPLRIKVPIGTRFSRVAADLGRQGVVAQPRTWAFYARWKGLATGIKAGEYEIEPGMTPRELLAKMVSGQVLLHSLTIVDGWRVQELLVAMRHNPDIQSTLAPQTNLVQKLGITGPSAEGQFLPETYRFPSGTSDVELLRQAHVALTRVLDAAWAGRDPALPLQNAYELLTLASIVEKESGVPDELPKIAGLYLHRLSIGMRLQADPTLIYGAGESFEGQLHTVDLRADGPYNTYTRAGLPPTPIALAGAAAIQATAHPEKTDALYFVATGQGGHVFSATLEQHNAAVAQYLARQRRAAADRESAEAHR
jgi:UPF0755 protein